MTGKEKLDLLVEGLGDADGNDYAASCHWCRTAQPLDEDGYCADERACVERVRATWLAENGRVAS